MSLKKGEVVMEKYFDTESYMQGFEYEPPEPTEDDFLEPDFLEDEFLIEQESDEYQIMQLEAEFAQEAEIELAMAMNTLEDLIIQSGTLYNQLLDLYKRTGRDVNQLKIKHPELK